MDPKQFSGAKIMGHLDRVGQWRDTGTTSPVTMELDLTNKCPCRCPQCFGYWPERNAAEWPTHRAMCFLTDCANMGVRGVTFTGGGEPTRHPQLAYLMQKANEMLGFPIEVISGIEEARLVYLGVAHTLADDDGKRLVIDIGGGSTEFIIGERFAPIELESLHMGCVTFSDRYFPNGELTEDNFRRAINAAQSELLSIQSRYQKLGWQNVVGSSGTMRATSRVLQNYGLTDGDVTLEGLLGLKKIILKPFLKNYKLINSLMNLNQKKMQMNGYLIIYLIVVKR